MNWQFWSEHLLLLCRTACQRQCLLLLCPHKICTVGVILEEKHDVEVDCQQGANWREEGLLIRCLGTSRDTCWWIQWAAESFFFPVVSPLFIFFFPEAFHALFFSIKHRRCATFYSLRALLEFHLLDVLTLSPLVCRITQQDATRTPLNAFDAAAHIRPIHCRRQRLRSLSAQNVTKCCSGFFELSAKLGRRWRRSRSYTPQKPKHCVGGLHAGTHSLPFSLQQCSCPSFYCYYSSVAISLAPNCNPLQASTMDLKYINMSVETFGITSHLPSTFWSLILTHTPVYSWIHQQVHLSLQAWPCWAFEQAGVLVWAPAPKCFSSVFLKAKLPYICWLQLLKYEDFILSFVT